MNVSERHGQNTLWLETGQMASKRVWTRPLQRVRRLWSNEGRRVTGSTRVNSGFRLG